MGTVISVLRTTPASLVIAKPHLEGGLQVIGGLNMSINKKEQVIHLPRTRDYLAILKWVGMQPIIDQCWSGVVCSGFSTST